MVAEPRSSHADHTPRTGGYETGRMLAALMLIALIAGLLGPQSARAQGGLAASISGSEETGRVSRFEVKRILREDCRDIIRKARFYLSAKCQFDILRLQHLRWFTYQSLRYRFATDEFLREQSGSAPVDGVTRVQDGEGGDTDTLPEGPIDGVVVDEYGLARNVPPPMANYDPLLDPDLDRRNEYLDATRELQDARRAIRWHRGKGLPIPQELLEKAKPHGGKERRNVLKLTLLSRGFIRDVRFMVDYKLTWFAPGKFEREILRVYTPPPAATQEEADAPGSEGEGPSDSPRVPGPDAIRAPEIPLPERITIDRVIPPSQ